MASTAATLAIFTPAETEVFQGGQVALRKVGGLAALAFQGQQVGGQQISNALFNGCLPRGPAGYSGTTGIKAVVVWSVNPGVKNTLAPVWGGSFQLAGQTDTPDPKVENFPAYGATNEVRATGTINSTVAGGMNYTLLTIPLAKIQNGQTTAPAAGDFYRFRLRRCLEQAADTLTDDAFVHCVELYDY